MDGHTDRQIDRSRDSFGDPVRSCCGQALPAASSCCDRPPAEHGQLQLAQQIHGEVLVSHSDTADDINPA